MSLPGPIKNPKTGNWIHPATGDTMSEEAARAWLENMDKRDLENEVCRLRFWNRLIVNCLVLTAAVWIGYVAGVQMERRENEPDKRVTEVDLFDRTHDYDPDGRPRFWGAKNPRYGSDLWKERERESNPRTATPKPPIVPDNHDIFRKRVYVYQCPKGDEHRFNSGGDHRCPKHRIPMEIVRTEFAL